jgi:hypothetical protein
VISPSEGRHLHTGQHEQKKTHTNIHVLSGIRTHDPSIRALDRAATVIGQFQLYKYQMYVRESSSLKKRPYANQITGLVSKILCRTQVKKYASL